MPTPPPPPAPAAPPAPPAAARPKPPLGLGLALVPIGTTLAYVGLLYLVDALGRVSEEFFNVTFVLAPLLAGAATLVICLRRDQPRVLLVLLPIATAGLAYLGMTVAIVALFIIYGTGGAVNTIA